MSDYGKSEKAKSDITDDELMSLLKSLPEDKLRAVIDGMASGQGEHLHMMMVDYLESLKRETAQRDFLAFVKVMWPNFIAGKHHSIMARAFERIARGELKRLIINMPPRFTKSEFASYLLPAWFLGQYPSKKIIQASNTAELAVNFGRKVRNLVDGDVFPKVFPNVSLRHDSKAAGRWATNMSGEYFAIGVEGTVTGKGADLLIIDDPHALEITTPIATPGGFVEIQQLKIGDCVFGPNGEPTEVVAKSSVYHNRELYEASTYDGAKILCDAKHLWSVRTATRTNDPYNSLPAEDLVEPRSNPFMLPRHAAVQYPAQNLFIDPWVLGAWLGDGTSSVGRMTAHPDDAVFMRAEFERRGYATNDLTDKWSFGVSSLFSQLRKSGLLNNKHIPEAYLIASAEQRLALLQGLMDTDGNVTEAGQCAFHNKDAALVDQVVELLRSLGRKCQRRTYYSKGKFGACLMHRVTFKLKNSALMPRKRERTKNTDDKQHRSVTIQPTGKTGSVQCITVSRTDGLFLAGRGYVVTHNSEQQAKLAESDPAIFDKVYEWYTSGPRQRLQPGGSICIIQTRWSKRDLTGQVLKAAAQRSGEDWEVIQFPAILPSGNSMWPEFWDIKELEQLRSELPSSKWQAQYMQQPTSDVSAIIKREWWKIWEKDKPPNCEFIIQSWDTAFLKTERADYSACTTWGVFYRDDEKGINRPNIILLNAFKKRMEFPELKQRAFKEFNDWDVDSLIVEAKAAGSPLIFELRAMGIPVQDYTPTKGNDKIARLNAVSDLFASGHVWVPNTHWAEELIEEVASFPSGDHDDLVDSMSQALLRYRRGGFIQLASDEEDEPREHRKKMAYY